MARLGRTADQFPEKLKCQTFEWKTDLCRHHIDQPPPLMNLLLLKILNFKFNGDADAWLRFSVENAVADVILQLREGQVEHKS